METTNIAPEPEIHATQTETVTSESSKKSNKKTMIIVVVIVTILLLAALLAGLWWFLMGRNTATQNNTAAVNSSSNSSDSAFSTNLGTDLTDAQQVALFQNLATTFTAKSRAIRVTTTSSTGDSYVYENDPATEISGFTGSVSGQETAGYTTASAQYFKVDGVWYFMPKDDTTDSSVAPKEPDYSDSDFIISDQQDIESKTSYQGTVSCPGTYQGTCYKFSVTDSNGGSSTVYFNGNEDLVYSVTYDVTTPSTTTSDYVYDNVNVTLPAEAQAAVNYNDYIQNLINGGGL